MHKQLGAIMLVAGTAIGSGMIALPMVLAKMGLITSMILMISMWILIYYTSLISLELNLQAALRVGKGLDLRALCGLFSGPYAEWIGALALKALSYALLIVYVHGSASILQKMIISTMDKTYALSFLITGYAVFMMSMLILPMRLLDYLNRFLFIGLLAAFAILVTGLLSTLTWSHLPLWPQSSVMQWTAVVPVVFTAFGFQVIFHTLTNYCQKDALMLKRAFFWGSLITAIVYMIWIGGVLSAVYQHNPVFYQQIAADQIEVGDLINVLRQIAQGSSVQLLVWCISLLAMVTSVLGIGVGLCDAFKDRAPQIPGYRVISAMLVVAPAYVVALYIPRAFITMLGFAGMVLVVIAIGLPVYLLSRTHIEQPYYPLTQKRWLLVLSAMCGMAIIACELFKI